MINSKNQFVKVQKKHNLAENFISLRQFCFMKLLYINKNINLSKPIISQLRMMGFEVDVLIESLPQQIDKHSLIHRFGNIFYRLVLKDKQYFIRKEKQRFEKFAEKRLKNKKYDIAFFIRADMYSEAFVKKVRQQSSKMVSYQWDGLEIFPKIFDYYKYFDRKLVFDGDDISKFPQYNLLPLTNFYYTEGQSGGNMLDLFYVGVGLEERIRMSYAIEDFAEKNGLTFKAILTVPDFRREVAGKSVNLVHQGISIEENERYASMSKSVVDFKMNSHNGASFRVFECLKMEKKLISNHHRLRDYEFYHPDNIFLTDFLDLTGLKAFLEKPYHPIDQKIVDKYGIKNWVNYALDYGDYEPINIP